MKKLLIIDDNAEDRTLYRRLLRPFEGQERLEISEASEGTAGLALFRELRPDCVLLDYNLPDTDGLTMLAQLRALVPAETLCVVMITGDGSERLAVRALNSGALDYLVKGQFDRDLLDRAVRHAIEKNEWRQYVARYHDELQEMNQELRDSLSALTATRQELNTNNLRLQAANEEIQARNLLLARTNQDLDNFVYAASHDLKQPVNNLTGLLGELRLSARFDEPDQATILRLIDDSLRGLSTTITDLAAVVQEQREPGEQPAEYVLLGPLLDEVLTSLRPQLLETAGQVEADFSALPGLEYVRSNLRTILLNLLSNALKYRHPARPPRIQLRTYRDGTCPAIAISDNGLGINLERHRSELFHLFRRFHPEAGEGTGVGLFLVNRLVQSTGGRIEVESEQHQGTTFRLRLCAQEYATQLAAQVQPDRL
ncbi:MAG: hybrid sensor histidine kinase/response regulator [Bacteroidota bacterium]|nr:hybrid sensor histidine kinase/response regulator [Bacteroidota bacterium]